MKKLLIGILLIVTMTGCEYERVKLNDEPITTDIHEIEWNGHTYIQCTTTEGGCSILHDESCECKNKED